MASRRQYSAEQMIQAIYESKGILASAARRLGCTRQTVHNYVNKFQTVKAAYEDARESNIDYVEGKLMYAIEKGHVPAIIFFLKTIGKNRGFVERQEVAGVSDAPMHIVVNWEDGNDSV